MKPGFTGSRIDRADNLRLDEEKLAALAADPGARLLALDGADPALDGEGALRWTGVSGGDLIFLGLDDGRPLFAPLPEIDPAQRAWSVFGLLSIMSSEDASVWGTARSLIAWHNAHPFCARCGAATQIFRGGWGRKCGTCAVEHYPRVDPVVIMLAEHRGKVLVGRQPQYPPGRYSALAGFVEPGESIEEAVIRELKEEAGIEADEVRYVASQPWPFPGQLMIACIAAARSDILAIDPTELEDAFWVDRDGVVAALEAREGAPFLAPPRFAIANSLLRHWAGGF